MIWSLLSEKCKNLEAARLLSDVNVENRCEIVAFGDGRKARQQGRPSVMNSLPLSVIVPTYNCAEFLPAAIESLFTAPFLAPEQVVIIDDCSTDNTAEVIDRLQDSYPNLLRLSTEKRSGAAVARRQGLERASANLVAFLDADDWVSPGAMYFAHRAIVETGAELCTFRMQQVSSTGETLFTYPLALEVGEITDGRNAACLSLMNWNFYANGVCSKDNWVRAYEGVPMGLVGSDELVSRQLLLYSRTVTVCAGVYNYRIRPSSTTQSQRSILRDDLSRNLWLLKFATEYQLYNPIVASCDSLIQDSLSASLVFMRDYPNAKPTHSDVSLIFDLNQNLVTLAKTVGVQSRLRGKFLLGLLLIRLTFRSRFLTRILARSLGYLVETK